MILGVVKAEWTDDLGAIRFITETPEETAADPEEVALHFLQTWRARQQ
jgi:hypothetical protein